MTAQKLQFAVDINAPREKVWQVLWNDDTYRKWTSAFHEGSHAVSDWNEGSRIQFLGPDGSGMYSRIATKIPNEFMSFEHLGIVKDGKELPPDEETKKWEGAHENYTLKKTNAGTRLEVELDIAEEYESMFKEMFPRALSKVKEISELN